MFYPPSHNGNMPAGQVPRRCIRGGQRLHLRMRIGITEVTPIKLKMLVNTRPTLGDSLICTGMSGSGPQTGIRSPIPAATRWWILPVRRRARLGSGGVVLGSTTGRTCVRLSATAAPPASAPTTSASVLVSKSSKLRAPLRILFSNRQILVGKGRGKSSNDFPFLFHSS